MEQIVLNSFSDEQLETLAETLCRKAMEKISENQTSVVLLTQSEVQEFFHVSRSTLWRWIRDGLVTPRRVGRKQFFDKAQLLKLM